MTPAFGGQYSIQLSYGATRGILAYLVASTSMATAPIHVANVVMRAGSLAFWL